MGQWSHSSPRAGKRPQRPETVRSAPDRR